MLMIFVTKLNFIVFMVRCFFLLCQVLVAEDYELSQSTFSKCAINSGMSHNSSFIHLFFFYFNCLPDDFLCNITIWATLNSLCAKTCDLFKQVEICNMSCNLVLKIKIVGKYLYFHQLLFDFEVSRFGT